MRGARRTSECGFGRSVAEAAEVAEAASIALVDPIGEPFGGERARDLGTLELDLRQHRARKRASGGALGEVEHAGVNRRTLEALVVVEREIAADLRVVEADATPEHAHGELRV